MVMHNGEARVVDDGPAGIPQPQRQLDLLVIVVEHKAAHLANRLGTQQMAKTKKIRRITGQGRATNLSAPRATVWVSLGECHRAAERIPLQKFNRTYQETGVGDFTVVVKARDEYAMRRADSVVSRRAASAADLAPDHADPVQARNWRVGCVVDNDNLVRPVILALQGFQQPAETLWPVLGRHHDAE